MNQYIIKDTCIVNEGKNSIWRCIGKERDGLKRSQIPSAQKKTVLKSIGKDTISITRRNR